MGPPDCRRAPSAALEWAVDFKEGLAPGVCAGTFTELPEALLVAGIEFTEEAIWLGRSIQGKLAPWNFARRRAVREATTHRLHEETESGGRKGEEETKRDERRAMGQWNGEGGREEEGTKRGGEEELLLADCRVEVADWAVGRLSQRALDSSL